METKDIIMICAVIIGPIAAVQIQKLLEVRRENRIRKTNIFKALMATRVTRVSTEHIQALNLIDVEFIGSKYKSVTAAWRLYHDHLGTGNPQAAGWSSKMDDLFIELLFEMAKSLGYSFDKVMLRRTGYSPIAQGEMELDKQTIRKGLAQILSGNAWLPVVFTSHTNSDENE